MVRQGSMHAPNRPAWPTGHHATSRRAPRASSSRATSRCGPYAVQCSAVCPSSFGTSDRRRRRAGTRDVDVSVAARVEKTGFHLRPSRHARSMPSARNTLGRRRDGRRQPPLPDPSAPRSAKNRAASPWPFARQPLTAEVDCRSARPRRRAASSSSAICTPACFRMHARRRQSQCRVEPPPYASDSALTSAPASSSDVVISTMFGGVFWRKSSTPLAET